MHTRSSTVPFTHRYLRPLLCLGFLLACLTLPMVQAQEVAEAKPGALSVVHVGNSHSHPLRLLVPLTELAGHPGYKEGSVNILGASLSWIWDHGDQCKWPETLAADKKWDAITLLSWGGKSDNEFAPKFAGEVFKGNPNAQVYIYVIWPDSNMSFEKPDPIRTEAHGEEVAAAVAAAFPNAPKPRVIPTSMLMRELGRLADIGEFPGTSSRYDLFSDGGHLSDIGMYAANVMVSAMLYGESPENYPSAIIRKDANGNPITGTYQSLSIPDETAAVIKRVVWDILQTYEPAGMKPGLVIATRLLEPAIADQPYNTQLKALNAKGASTWSLADGKLPAGITLSPDGSLSGKSSVTGKFPLVVKLVTESGTIDRPLVLNVNKNIPPSIPNQPLPEVSLDSYVFQPLKADGGVGTLTWSLSAGQLPYGIMVSPAGMLVGTPGEQGQFTFTIKAEDSNPAGMRSAEKEFTWKIGPARQEALQVKYVITEGWDFVDVQRTKDWDKLKFTPERIFKVDGKLDETFWKFDQPIAKKTQGTPEKKAVFGAAWTANCTGNTQPGKPLPPGRMLLGDLHGRAWSLGGTQFVVAVKVKDGPNGKTEKDGVHFFLDGRHDGKIIYGADDLHFYVPRNFKKNGEWAQMIRGLKAPWFNKVFVSEIEGGYVVEIAFGPANFTGNGQWLPFGAQGVYGFDIAVDEGTEGNISQQVWRGNDKNADDTSHLGNVVLIAKPAIEPPPLPEVRR